MVLEASYCFISFISFLLEGRLWRLIRIVFKKLLEYEVLYYYLVLLIRGTISTCAGSVRKSVMPTWVLFSEGFLRFIYKVVFHPETVTLKREQYITSCSV